MPRLASPRQAALLAASLIAACYPGLQNTHGSVNNLSMDGEPCTGIRPGTWSWPSRRSDHCWAFKRGAGTTVRVKVRSGDSGFEAILRLRYWLDDGLAVVDGARVRGLGTWEVLAVELPRSHRGIYVIEVTEVNGGSYAVYVK